MPYFKSLINTLFFAITFVVVTSCVPKATEKKAVCGTNEAFNNVTRACFSISETRAKPFGTKSSDTLFQETAKDITLSYTDINKNLATSCKVVSTNSGFVEMISPVLMNGSLFNKAAEVQASAHDIAERMNLIVPGSATILDNAILAAFNKAKNTFSYANVISDMGDFKTSVNALLIDARIVADVNVQYFSELTTSRLEEYEALHIYLVNRCECTAGVCTTTAVPKIDKSGAAGFNYTITDEDGEGPSKGVSLSITPMAGTVVHLKPAAESSYHIFTESPTSFAKATLDSVIFEGASDLYSTLANSYTYSIVSVSSGSVSSCGFSGLNYICNYTPPTADDNDLTNLTIPATASTAAITDFTFTARAHGTAGNNISVEFINMQGNNLSPVVDDQYLTSIQKFGMVDTVPNPDVEGFVRVDGNKIKVFINEEVITAGQVLDLLTGHPKVARMINVTLAFGADSNSVNDSGGAVSLTGGADAFAKIIYIVNNGKAISTNTATALISITPVNDAPLTPIEDSSAADHSEAMTEDTAKVFSINYRDVDHFTTLDSFNITAKVETGPACITNMTPAYFTGLVSAPGFGIAGTGPGVSTLCNATTKICSKSITITPPADFAGNTCLYYRVADAAGAPSLRVQLVRLNISNVNDAPTIQNVANTSTGEDVAIDIPYTIADVDNTLSCTSSITVTSSNPTVIPNNLTVNLIKSQVSPGSCNLRITPASNQSGTSTITLSVTDGSVIASDTFVLTVTPVNDAPVFLAPTTAYVVETNEGGTVQTDAFWADEDAVDSVNENADGLFIQSITSDNSSVLPVSGISVFYDLNDNGSFDVGEQVIYPGSGVLDIPAIDVRLHKFYLILDPVDGVSGNSNITINLREDILVSPLTVSKTFSFVVNPVAALHGGWSNISSVGIKTDKNGAPVSESEIVCKYNKIDDTEKCTSGVPSTNTNCVGSSAPNGIITPTAANVLYWDNSNKRCYRSQASDTHSWAEMKTSCPVTRQSVVTTESLTAIATSIKVTSTIGFPLTGSLMLGTETVSYSGKNATTFTGLTRAIIPTTGATGLIVRSISNPKNYIRDIRTGVNAPLPAQSLPMASAVEQYYYEIADGGNTCKKSTESSPGVFAWSATPYTPSKITLSWNSFTIVGSGSDSSVSISGWNVYRRERNESYNFKGGHLTNVDSSASMTITDSSIRTFIDTTAISGKVYYYLVRPVDNRHNLPTYTPEIFSEVRLLAPPANYAFVHRWMANQEVCNSMNMTTSTPAPNRVDPTRNYRCPYSGPGETAGYYDIGKDMLVDIQEMGCPFTAAPACTSNGCVGIANPSTLTLTGLNTNDVFYNRSSGSCFIYNGATWANASLALNAQLTANAPKMYSALNPPLVNINSAKAESICALRGSPSTDLTANGGLAAQPAFLPEKKEYIAYSAHPKNLSDSVITDTEQGFSLNVQSRCNSSSASGIESAYTDSIIPSTSYNYSIPGTDSSGIRSLYTGSIPWVDNKSTEACVSRYGIQDLYGNVKEWVRDIMTCYDGTTVAINAFTCEVTSTTSMLFDMFTSGNKNYGFNLVTGPHNDSGITPGVSSDDGYLTEWAFSEQLFGAGKFSFPLALPVHADIDDALTGANIYNSLLDIGPGISTNRLHEDRIIINAQTIVTAGDGGTPNDFGNASIAVGGSYLSGTGAGRYTSQLIPQDDSAVDAGFRCLIPIPNSGAGTTKYLGDSAHTYPY